MEFKVIIPARYASTRFPGKVLADIKGKPMLQWVYERSVNSGADSVVIATDDDRVAEVAESFGAKVCMTSPDHTSGTERLSEAVAALDYEPDDIVVNVQADDPLIPSEAIRQVAVDLDEHDNVKVTTLCDEIQNAEELFNPGVVKVVMNRRNYAMYFTRAVVPWEREQFDHMNPEKELTLVGHHFRHLGLYAYRVSFLEDYMEWAHCELESLEMLEQLRILWNGGRIHVSISKKKLPPTVDTKEDLEKILELLNAKNSN